eukprot:350926_1
MAVMSEVQSRKEAEIYDHYFCNFETYDQPIDTYSVDDRVERFIFIHGRCKGDLTKPNVAYRPLLRSILSAMRHKFKKKAIIYMPEYHEYIGLDPYEPWSLKSGPISRELRETVLWQISKWKHKPFSFITNSWGCWHTMKLLNHKNVKDYVKRVVFIAPVFNCWMIEQQQKYILDASENIKIGAIYGSNDMQCANDSKDGGVEQCLSAWFHKTHLVNVTCIEGGTHGGIYDAIPNAKWNRRKWIIGASTGHTAKVSKYEEPPLPQHMNEQQYRDTIAHHLATFMFGDASDKNESIATTVNMELQPDGMELAV